MIRPLLLLNGCQQYDVRMWEKFEETDLEPEAFVEEGRALWERLGVTERCMNLMEKLLASGWVDRELDACERLGVRLVTCRDAIYPKSLLELEDAPMLLYVRGEKFSVGAKAIGVVGTRRCSAYGAGVAREIGRLSAADGWSVVSGGAKGIDGAAHEGCLEGSGQGGHTVAVLGTGIDIVYPAEHRGLFERIAERGALYSEYPLGANGVGWRFPRRNRIVVGLAARTVVVEAPHKSGAMITARLAAEAGREVWSVPGRIGDDRCAGSNRLIFDGAMPLIDMETFFGTRDPQRTLFEGVETPPAKEDVRLNDVEKTLIALLMNGGDRTIDNLAGEAKMSAAEVFKAMSLLSLRGLVFSSGPGRYRLTD